jgi:hypothetical protein
MAPATAPGREVGGLLGLAPDGVLGFLGAAYRVRRRSRRHCRQRALAEAAQQQRPDTRSYAQQQLPAHLVNGLG